MKFTKKEIVTSDDTEINVLHILNEYADITPFFRNEFLNSCDNIFQSQGFLTGKQINTLVEIYNKIDV